VAHSARYSICIQRMCESVITKFQSDSSRTDSSVRILYAQPASPVSVGHDLFTKTGAVFPRVSEGVAESLWPNFLNFGRHLLSPRAFFVVSFLMSFLAQFDLKENQSKLFAAAARRYARSGASSVAERARPNHLRRSVNLSAATCCRISSRDTEGPVRLRILLAVIGTLSRCSAWMAASIVSIFHLTWLVLIASHSRCEVADAYCMAFALAVRRLRGTPIPSFPSMPEIYVLDRVLSRRNDPGGCFDLETLQVGGNAARQSFPEPARDDDQSRRVSG
jgi:hypothetical protein